MAALARWCRRGPPQTAGALGSRKYVEYCRGINESGQYLLGVISDVLAMSELEAGHTRLNKTRLEIEPILEAVRLRIHKKSQVIPTGIDLAPYPPRPAQESALRASRRVDRLTPVR